MVWNAAPHGPPTSRTTTFELCLDMLAAGDDGRWPTVAEYRNERGAIIRERLDRRLMRDDMAM